jgi:hypothetical protein
VTYLNDLTDKGDDVGKFGHVDIEVIQLILQGLVRDDATSFADGAQTAQVAGRVEGRVRWPGQVDLGHVVDGREGRQRRHGAVAAVQGRLEA